MPNPFIKKDLKIKTEKAQETASRGGFFVALGENMIKSETEIDINRIPPLVEESGIGNLTGVSVAVGKTRAGADQLEITGPAKKFSLNSGNGLGQIQKGDLKLLVDRLAAAATVLPGNIEAPKLLEEERFKKACLTEVDLGKNLQANKLAQEIADMTPDKTPVFYGSTSGINFAEVLETALCARALQDRGIDSQVIFDFDAAPGEESRNIFYDSVMALPNHLQERATRFSQSVGGGLMGGRLKAVRELLRKVEGLPEVNLVDGREIFNGLGGRFTLGQLLVLARLAGNDPRLFEDGCTSISCMMLLSEAPSLDLLKEPVGKFIGGSIKPAGFTYYAREAVMGSLGGVAGRPLKLTEKANIYKIMLSTTALFDEQTLQGTIFFPISRFRIPAGLASRPVDPVALMVLAEDDPGGFERLVRGFVESFRVLTPDQAKESGTKDRKFAVEDHFNLGGKDG